MQYNLNNIFYFQWLQLTDAIPKTWKKIVQNNVNINKSLKVKEHDIIQKNRTISIYKLKAKELYSTLLWNVENKLPSPIHFNKIFPTKRKMGQIISTALQETKYLRCFQYRILNYIPYLSRKFYMFDIWCSIDNLLCFYCKTEYETTLHVFHSI